MNYPLGNNEKTLQAPCMTVTQRRVEELLSRFHI